MKYREARWRRCGTTWGCSVPRNPPACGCPSRMRTGWTEVVRRRARRAPGSTIKRPRIVAEGLDPEALLNRGAQPLGSCTPCCTPGVFTALSRQRRHREQRGVGVALHFDHRDRSARQAAVSVRDRVATVLPTLVSQPQGTRMRMRFRERFRRIFEVLGNSDLPVILMHDRASQRGPR